MKYKEGNGRIKSGADYEKGCEVWRKFTFGAEAV